MPVHRQLLASDGCFHVEHVKADGHGAAWGAVHEAKEWRCVLPGQGQVQWRSGDELLVVDALTAFRLDPGDAYQLRHAAERRHAVLFNPAGHVPLPPGRAWLLQPRELFEIRRGLAELRRGDHGDVTGTGSGACAALARAHPLACEGAPLTLLHARQAIAATEHLHLNVEEVAEEVRCSAFHLAHLFRRHLGTSPHQYRLHLRLAHALLRLEEAGTRLADLAFELGFSSQSHFGEAFRRAIGCTPAQARVALR